jgi:Fe-S-cluster containining protein
VKTSAELGLTHCNRCGECCRKSTCHLEQQDASRIAQHLGISRREFALKYLQVILPADGKAAVKPRMTQDGCIFLKNNECSIQSVKPKGGRDYQCWTPQGSGERYWWPSDRLSRIGVKVQ